MMKQFLRKTMKNIAAYVELVLSAFLIFAIGVLIIKLVGQCFLDIWHDKLELEYYMEYAMSLAIGVEFVKNALYTPAWHDNRSAFICDSKADDSRTPQCI